VHRGAQRIHRDGDWHVNNIEFVNRFHAQISKSYDTCCPDRLGNKIGGAADGHEVSRF